MLWYDVTYRVINECRRMAPPAAEGGVQLNGLIHDFIDRCFFRTQSLAIRRLVEKNPERRGRDVISLRRLLDDIRASAHLLTRGNMFEADGLPYDYSAQKTRAQEDAARRRADARAKGKGGWFLDSELEQAWHVPADLHQDFDRMSRTAECERSPSDMIDPCLLDALEARLEPCIGVTTYVNKLVAHAAHPSNRDAVPERERTLCLARIYECHEALCLVASSVSVHILRQSPGCFLAVPLFDQFAYIERPWVAPENVSVLQQVWDQQYSRVKEWSRPGWPEGW